MLHRLYRPYIIAYGYFCVCILAIIDSRVRAFGRIFGECLVESGNVKVLEDAKTILTPYGGRFEYDVSGIKFNVHLKHADRVQKGSFLPYRLWWFRPIVSLCKPWQTLFNVSETKFEKQQHSINDFY